MTISQLSIFAENKPGTIYEITRTIADAGVDIRALSVADTQDLSLIHILRLKPLQPVALISN